MKVDEQTFAQVYRAIVRANQFEGNAPRAAEEGLFKLTVCPAE
jgi:hypothetical protein